MNPSDNKRLLAALNENWQAEMEGFSTYSALAKNENDPHRRNALRGLATAEKHHADLWAERIKGLGGTEPQFNGNPLELRVPAGMYVNVWSPTMKPVESSTAADGAKPAQHIYRWSATQLKPTV